MDITKIKTKILEKKTLEENDVDLLFFSSIIKNYSKNKKKYYDDDYQSGFDLDYILNIESSNQTDQTDQTNQTNSSNYRTLSEISGNYFSNFFSNRQNNQTNSTNPTKSNNSDGSDDSDNSVKSLSDTASDYDFDCSDFTENVNDKMGQAICDLNDAIIEKGINYFPKMNSNIVFVDNNQLILDEYNFLPEEQNSEENISEQENANESNESNESNYLGEYNGEYWKQFD